MLANPRMEQIASEELRALQLTRLQKAVAWAYEKSGFYRRKLEAAGIRPEDIASLDDILRLPFTTAQELQENSVHEFLTLPLSAVCRISLWEHPKPFVRMYTERDITRHVELMTRALAAADISRASVVGILGDLADSGLMDTQRALEILGASAVPLGTDYERVIRLMDAAHLDTLAGSSRRVLRLIVQLQAMGREIRDFGLSSILCFNENLQNPLKMHMQNRTGTRVYNFVASASFGASGILYQCGEQSGHHLQEDCFYSEIADFGRDEIVQDEVCMGELVLTSLTAEALPLLRYRTGQTVMRMDQPCPCGRTFLRFMTPFGAFN